MADPRPDIEERGRLVAALLTLYGKDEEIARDLESLGALSDPVTDLRAVDEDQSPQATAYRSALDAFVLRYGLNLLPSVPLDKDPFGEDMWQPSGKAFVHGWCFKRRTPVALPAEQLGRAAGYAGVIPKVRVSIDLEWEPTRESRAEARARLEQIITSQLDAGLAGLRSEGYRFDGRPADLRDEHLRWLFERMRSCGRRTYAEIAKAAQDRKEHVSDDPEDAARWVRKAVSALANYLGVRLPTAKGN